MAANFGYNEQYVDDEMDTESLFYHLDYVRDNPPAGTMLKLFFESFGSAKKGNKPSSKPQQEASKLSRSLEDFIADFTGAGGSIK